MTKKSAMTRDFHEGWVTRAIAAAKRRALRDLKAAPYGKQEQRYGSY